MIILVDGFTVPPTATFGGRIMTETPDPDIRISCSPASPPQREPKRLVVTYPSDRHFVICFLTWLRCRQRTKPKDFEWNLDQQNQDYVDAKAYIMEHLQVNHLKSENRLLGFACTLRLAGNDKYEQSQYDEAIDYYYNALLVLSEWENLVTQSAKWLVSSLDCQSNILQASIRSNQYANAAPILGACIRLSISSPEISLWKRGKSLYRCALIVESLGNPSRSHVLATLANQLWPNEESQQLIQRLESTFDLRRCGNRPSAHLIPTFKTLKPTDFEGGATCSICIDEFSKAAALALPCNHNFHINCITPWLEIRDTCPNCRKCLNN